MFHTIGILLRIPQGPDVGCECNLILACYFCFSARCVWRLFTRVSIVQDHHTVCFQPQTTTNDHQTGFSD